MNKMKWSNYEDKLLKAILKGDVQEVEEALVGGANVKSRDVYGRTPLILIIAEGKLNRIEIAERLLRAGADVNAQNRSGKTALIEAAMQDDIQAVQLLIQHGADVNIQDKNGNKALKIAVGHGNKTMEQILRKSATHEDTTKKRGG